MKKGDNFIRIYREYKFDMSYRYCFPLSYPQYYEEWQSIEIAYSDYERKLYYKQMRVTEPSEKSESLLSFEDLEKRREIPVDPNNCDWYKKYMALEEDLRNNKTLTIQKDFKVEINKDIEIISEG